LGDAVETDHKKMVVFMKTGLNFLLIRIQWLYLEFMVMLRLSSFYLPAFTCRIKEVV
jgi:hypothetical protein